MLKVLALLLLAPPPQAPTPPCPPQAPTTDVGVSGEESAQPPAQTPAPAEYRWVWDSAGNDGWRELLVSGVARGKLSPEGTYYPYLGARKGAVVGAAGDCPCQLPTDFAPPRGISSHPGAGSSAYPFAPQRASRAVSGGLGAGAGGDCASGSCGASSAPVSRGVFGRRR